MLKPIFAVVATMFLSWWIAVTIQQFRSVPQSEDVIIECVACHKPCRMPPTPLYCCPDCGLYQVASVVTDD